MHRARRHAHFAEPLQLRPLVACNREGVLAKTRTRQRANAFLKFRAAGRAGQLAIPPNRTFLRSERFLKMKTGQAAAGLLGVHGLGDFGSDVSKPAFSIKADSRFLNLRGAQNHPGKSERTRFRLRMIEHALRDASAAVALVEIHPTKFRVVDAVAFNTKRTDDFAPIYDDPEGVALCRGKDFEKLPQLSVDGRRDVSLEQRLHPIRREFSIDARPQ
jgi:hypothetical protein